MFCFSDQLNQMKMWTVHFPLENSQQYFFFKQTLLVNSRGSIFSLPTYLASKDLYSLEKLSCSTILSSSVAINDWISFRKMDLLGCFNLDFNYSKSNKDHNFRFRFSRGAKRPKTMYDDARSQLKLSLIWFVPHSQNICEVP